MLEAVYSKSNIMSPVTATRVQVEEEREFTPIANIKTDVGE